MSAEIPPIVKNPIDPCSLTPNDCPRLEAVHKRLDDGSAWMALMDRKFDAQVHATEANSSAIMQLSTNLTENTSATEEILEIIRTAKGFFRGVGALGSLVKWAAGIGAAVLAFWFTLKNGKAP